ncbi:MAG: hypothetical protein ACK5HR_03950, partial [Mycoplasmatales bacterium]
FIEKEIIMLKILKNKIYDINDFLNIEYVTFSQYENKEMNFILEKNIVQNYNSLHYRHNASCLKKETCVIPVKFIIEYMEATNQTKFKYSNFEYVSKFLIEKYEVINIPFDLFIIQD